jgi:hypothetical protein
MVFPTLNPCQAVSPFCCVAAFIVVWGTDIGFWDRFGIYFLDFEKDTPYLWSISLPAYVLAMLKKLVKSSLEFKAPNIS